MAASTLPKPRPKKRAIALAGGGPAAGFHIGALAALEAHGITFDVWSLSCIGAWVGTYYNHLPNDCPDKAFQTYNFFRDNAFRDTDSYRGFPVNKAFAPNLQAYARAWLAHSLEPQTYVDMFSVGNELADVAEGWKTFLLNPTMWQREGDCNAHVLNNILAVHPLSRFITSLAYASEVNGLSSIYYKDSTFLDHFKIDNLDLVDEPGLGSLSNMELNNLFERLRREGFTPDAERASKPEIYHNAYRLTNDQQNGPGKLFGSNSPPADGQLQLFNNKWAERWLEGKRKYLPITHPSLCACSALPYVEQTVRIPNDDGREYSEGALIDTVSFRDLVEDHPDLDEIWVCRIVDYGQVRLQKNLHDSLGNLCQQFAAEVGENDVELFKNHLRKCTGRIPRVVEIPLDGKTRINYRWDRENLDVGCAEGWRAVMELLEDSGGLANDVTPAPPWEPRPAERGPSQTRRRRARVR